MSCTAICGVGVGVAAGCSKLGFEKTCKGRNGGQTLVPVVGLVNRGFDSHLWITRWQHLQRQLQRSSKVREVANTNRRNLRPVPVATAALKALTVNEDTFDEEVLKSPIPVLVEYWATWCGPCRLMGMVMDWAAQEYEGRMKCVKIETDPNEGLKEKYKVYGLPTIILFVNGEEVPGSRREGAMNKEKLATLLQQILPSLASTN